MIYFLLGIIFGSVLELGIFILLLYFRKPMERAIAQLESKTKQKAVIFEPENEDWKKLLDIKKE